MSDWTQRWYCYLGWHVWDYYRRPVELRNEVIVAQCLTCSVTKAHPRRSA